MKIAVVGAGFTGAVIARELAMAQHHVEVLEKQDHIGGHCHTYRDPETGIMVHAHGAHIFHTNNERVWRYVRQFDEWVPYIHRVKAVAGGKVFSFPINLHTINQFFGYKWSPAEAEVYIRGKVTPFEKPRNFEEQALAFVGLELYRAFLKGYTEKQWGVDPTELPASTLKRLPLRYTYDDNYFNDPHQAMPRHGYTFVIENMLQGIDVHLNTKFWPRQRDEYDHVFYTGPLDDWFQGLYEPLGYRTLDFELIRAGGDYQGAAVINYCDADVPWTRIVEHKHFAPWEDHDKTIIYRERSRLREPCDEPYYPLRLAKDMVTLFLYEQAAKRLKNVTFVGRLGTYRYLDMHVAINGALRVADNFLGRTL